MYLLIYKVNALRNKFVGTGGTPIPPELQRIPSVDHCNRFGVDVSQTMWKKSIRVDLVDLDISLLTSANQTNYSYQAVAQRGPPIPPYSMSK
jgi:hypothetical protein